MLALCAWVWIRLRKNPDWDLTLPEMLKYVFIIAACIVSTIALNIHVKYFGLPTWLTFGYPIGKILPTSCAESMPVEGERELQCSFERFMEWAGRALRADGTGLHVDELERDCKRHIFMALLVPASTALAVILVWCAPEAERRKHGQTENEPGEEVAQVEQV